ncbi:hypothetical protein [Burkholderia cepacia]|uniref:hypothetical protein n=1 Tax=Burkholderia cepacia TaxID=292 RepID=UPI0020195262|nr:hypothetical protein [Burkholderia cepacia]UQO39932.1 hypothetical protein L0Z22_35035 [Burkholderia cepacia]UQO49219.1 hypothetical protein L0Z05_20845 [Burkholderia cepacia]UQP08905.1 hypothetical protein L0Z01_35020 [Burkholderia cepacia]
MESLWPANLLGDGPFLSQKNQLIQLLEDQALGISEATNGMVEGALRNKDIPEVMVYSLFVSPTNQPAKAFEFAVFRAPQADFPMVIEVFHLNNRIFKIKNFNELSNTLRNIFRLPETVRIMRTLAEESKQAGTVPKPNFESRNMRGGQVENAPRPISIGGVMSSASGLHASINLFGVAGFVVGEDIRNLAASKIPAHLLMPLNNRHVLTLKFVDAVKATLSSDELKVLQFEAKKALREHQT